MKVYYQNDHIEISIPVYIVANFKPIFEIKSYWKYSDIPKEIMKELTEDQQELMMYFFEENNAGL